MITERLHLDVRGLLVEVVRKDIRNLHLGVYPPGGRVRVAVPLRLDDEAVRLAVVSRFGWILRKRAALESQERQSKREMVTGETHYFQGQKYRLRVVKNEQPPTVLIKGKSVLEVRVRPGSETERREAMLAEWYRRELKKVLPGLLSKWEPKLGVQVGEANVKKMKTRWGSCNAPARRIWLNLELAKKPPACLEYVVVHEMLHLVDKRHNDHFRELLDIHYPKWRTVRDELNRAPLAHQDWTY